MSTIDYKDFLDSKTTIDTPSGFDNVDLLIPEQLFPFQKAIVKWALKRGRAAIFADTGLGKTFMQLAWANAVFQLTGNRVLIFAPLCVALQTVAEGEKIGISVKYIRDFKADGSTGVYIANYEMLEHFEPWFEKGYFDGIVIDESSILKHQDSKTRTALIKACSKIPYRLSCTATPSPNDYMELGSQAEFLGIMGTIEMLAMFFVHDSGETAKWRLKGHGKSKFWEWLAQWAVYIKTPADLGFDDSAYLLPALEVHEHVCATGVKEIASTLSERNIARRETIDMRVERCAKLVNESNGPFIVWCNLNDESAKLKSMIPDAVEIKGSDKLEIKEDRIRAFSEGRARVIITKPSITGFGLNWQHCAQMAFVGLNDSYEQLYQAIRRSYRFGQTKSVQVHLISSDREGAVRENILRKEKQAEEIQSQMVKYMADFSRRNVVELRRDRATYDRNVAKGPGFELHLSDCVDLAKEIESNSIDYTIFSPPFSSLYTYSNSERDMGNSKSDTEFYQHFKFLVTEMFRITAPGRLVSFHCMNLPTSKQNHGRIGIRDFRGDLIKMFVDVGFIYASEVCIWKDPVVAMQRTKALGLLWKQIKKDSSMSRQGIPDYVITMRKPGENRKPIAHTPEEFPVKTWQALASPCWMDIKQSNTLNRKLAREKDDERHICPLQLDLIERCMFLWTSPGDLVFSPFAGIGSEGYVALSMGRRFIGSELKRNYFMIADKNLREVNSDGYSFPKFSTKVEQISAPDPIEEVTCQETLFN